MSLSFESQNNADVYFVVLSSHKSDEDCSNDMKAAFQICLDQSLDPKWLPEEKCRKCKSGDTNVFVCEVFAGEIFNYLMKSRYTVIGPRVILDCMGTGVRIPKKNHPQFTLAMRDLIVTTTGFPDTVKAELAEKIQFMGGVYSSEFRQSVTHLVAHRVGSIKYDRALENGAQVMTQRWVEAAWEASQKKNVHARDEEFLEFRCPVFHNLIITCSQLNKETKEKVRRCVDDNGGEFNGQLVGSRTHILVIDEPVGEKYSCAYQLKLPCLRPAWVFDSVKEGYALAKRKYSLHKSPVRCSTPETDKTVHLPDFSLSTICNTVKSVDETVNNTLLPIKPSILERSQTTVSPYMKVVDSLDPAAVKKAGGFLDGCCVYLSGFSPEYAERLRKTLNSGGATRLNEISESVTHIIVGNTNPVDMAALKMSGVRPHVVSADWLVASVMLRSPAPEDNFICGNLLSQPVEQQSPLSKKGLQMLHSQGGRHVRSLSKPEKSPSVAPHSSVGRTTVDLEPGHLVQQYLNSSSNSTVDAGKDTDDTVLNLAKQNDGEETLVEALRENPNDTTQMSEIAGTQQSVTEEIFTGLVFSVAGFEQPVMNNLQESIEELGGQVTGRSFRGVADYEVVPVHGGPRYHTAIEVVTDLWVDECMTEKQLLPIHYYYQPLVLDSDQKPLQNCVIGISAYSGKERQFISIAVEVMGGLVQDNLVRLDMPNEGRRASTHLVCPNTEEMLRSRKFVAAQKWQVPAVTSEWVLACAREGRCMSVEQYRVLGNTSAEGSITGSNKGSTLQTTKPIELSTGVSNSTTTAGAPSVKQTVLQTTPSTPTMGNPSTPTMGNPCTSEPTPKAPGYMSTPETPYGQVFKANPSPNTRKRWKRYIDNFPQFPRDPVPTKQRRLSTPLSELKRQCWKKFGGIESSENSPDVTIQVSEEEGEEKMNKNLEQGVPEPKSNNSTPSRMRDNPHVLELNKILDTEEPQRRRARSSEQQAVCGGEAGRGGGAEKDGGSSSVGTLAGTNTESLDLCANYVEWVDPVVNNEQMCQKSNKPILKFLISSVESKERPQFSEMIERLGGELLQKQTFDSAATHFVCETLNRSEKLLASIASGKWVLHTSFIQDSNSAGHFLPEEQYEWGNPQSTRQVPCLPSNTLNQQLAAAAYRWRCWVQEHKSGPFFGMRVIICVAREKKEMFKRLIIAGGGTVLDLRPPFSDPGDATLCLLDSAKYDHPVDLRALVDQAVPCVAPIFLNNYLLNTPCPDPWDSLVSEYSALMSHP